MITFESQEEFEKAVMEIVTQRLGISISLERDSYYSDWNEERVYTYEVGEVSFYDKT